MRGALARANSQNVSVAQPTTQLNATEQDTLVKQIGLALLRAAPRDWRKVTAEYRAVGRYHELTGEIVTEDGTVHEWLATHDIATLFGRLRGGMYRDGRGTWFNARYQLDHPSSYNLEYNRDEPVWNLAPPPQAYSDELRMFPRTEENVPEWLIRRMSGLGPEHPGPHFRIARIFDTVGPAGRPVINRPDLEVEEQDRLLEYLENAPLVVPERGYDIDRLAATPEATVPVAFHSDGQWIWPAAVNFYLHKYGVSPEPDLVEHVRAVGFTRPPVDEPTLQAAAAYLTRGNQPPPPQQRPAGPPPQGPPPQQPMPPQQQAPVGPPPGAAPPIAPLQPPVPVEAPLSVHAPAEPEAPAEEHEYAPEAEYAEEGYDDQEFDDRFAEEDHQYGEGEYAQQPDHAAGANGSSPEPGRVPDLEETAEYVPDQPIGDGPEPPRDGQPFLRREDEHAAFQPPREDEHAFQPGQAAEQQAFEPGLPRHDEEPAAHHEDEPSHAAFGAGPAGPDDESGHAAFDTGQADEPAHAYQPGQPPRHDDEPAHAAFQPPRHEDDAPHAFQAPGQPPRHEDDAPPAFQPLRHESEAPHAFQAPGQPPRHEDDAPHAFQPPGQPPRHENEAPHAFQPPGQPSRRGEQPAFDPGPPTMITQPEVPGVLPVPDPPAPQPAAQAEPAGPPPQAPRPGRRALRRETPDHPVLAGLQAKLDELDVPESGYKLGEPAEHGWSVEEVEDGWRVGWYDGKLSNPAVFGDAEDAAAFMLGKLLLNPEGHVPAEEPPAPEPEPEPEPEPAPQRVVATLSPEVATGSYPVRKPEPVPPQEQTAFTSAAELFGDLEDEDEPPAPPRQPAPPAPAPAGPPPQALQQAGSLPPAPPRREPPSAPTVLAPAPQGVLPVPPAPPRREDVARPAVNGGGGGGQQQWPIGPMAGEPPLTLFRGKELRELPAGSELDRFGGPNGNLTYAAGTPFAERSLVPEWVNRPYHVYRVQRPLEALAGVAIPWFNQPGGGAAYLLPASIEDLVAEGDLIELDPGEPPID
ncbi:glycohydrolase toxin TNT-related protein [Amycolatopsis sp. NPDC026612]|uniref:glycohydrolase toxin TNT-related protein n=1 Tax=Amycolatopsis sp. NPDC026612 TaxID=3155466 RepID=UPI0033F8C8C6